MMASFIRSFSAAHIDKVIQINNGVDSVYWQVIWEDDQ